VSAAIAYWKERKSTQQKGLRGGKGRKKFSGRFVTPWEKGLSLLLQLRFLVAQKGAMQPRGVGKNFESLNSRGLVIIVARFSGKICLEKEKLDKPHQET